MRIALLGDSHSTVLFPYLAPKLEAAGHQVVAQEKHSGWGVKTYLKNNTVPNTLTGVAPDLVVVELGGNNTNFNTESYRDEMALLLAQLKAVGAKKVLWFGPATSDPNIDSYTANRHDKTAVLQAQLLPAMGVKWIDSRPATLTGQRSDGVHFTTSAYHHWGDFMYDHTLENMSLFNWWWLTAGTLSLMALYWGMRR